MGSPASPIVADIVMEQLLKTTMEKLEEKPRIMTKYVDDLFCIVKISAIEKTLCELNKFHKRIKFTMEEEINGRLPYLDTLIVRDGKNLKLDWYQKPTASGRIINFHSCQPKHVIMNTANNLIKRVLTISDKCFHKENIEKLEQILLKNAFPNNITKSLIKLCQEKQTKTEKTQLAYKTMTYIPGISERIIKAKVYDKEKYNVAFTIDNSLKHLFSNTKSKQDKMDSSNVVYKIKCMGDGNEKCNQVYVGTTKNKLKTRIAGHKSDLKNRNKLMTQKTALMAHCAEREHKPDLDKVDILQREDKYNKRYILEMLHIINIKKDQRINYKTDVENCAQVYRNIINKWRA